MLKLRRSEQRKGVVFGTLTLEISYGLSTLTIFGLQIAVNRALSSADYGVFSVLFSSMMIISSLVGTPLELIISSRVAEFTSKEWHCKQLLIQILRWLAWAILLVLLLAALLRPVLVPILFPEYPSAYYIMVFASVIASTNLCLMGILRGAREFVTYSAIMLADAALKVLVLLVLVYGMQRGVTGAMVSLALSSAICIPITIGAIWRHRSTFRGKAPAEKTHTASSTLRLFLPIVVLSGLGAYLNNTGPILIKWMGGSSSNDLAGFFLIAVTFSRLLPMVSRALGMSLLPNFVTFCANRQWEKVRHYFWLSYQLFAALSVVTVAGTYLFGIDIAGFFYPDFAFPQIGLTFLMAGSALLAFTSINHQLFVSTSQPHKAIFSWVIGCAIWTVMPLVMGGEILMRISVAFLLGCSVIFAIQVFLVIGILRQELE